MVNRRYSIKQFGFVVKGERDNMASFKNTILITGGTSGIGLPAAQKIAQRHPDLQIIVASRTDNNHAADSINKSLGQKNVVFVKLDQSTPAGVRDFRSRFQGKFPPISILILNAGVQFPGEIGFIDSIERTFAINHLGTAMVFHLMAPYLTSDAHIVVTASGVHDPAQKSGMPHPQYTTSAQVARPDPKKAPKDGRIFYTTSKLCNVLWTYALDRRIREQGKSWTAVVYEPGFVPETGLSRDYPAPLRILAQKVFPRMLPVLRAAISPNIWTAKESGGALADLATDPKLRQSGKYYSEKRWMDSSKDSYDEAKQEELWDFTVKELAREGEDFNRLG